MQLKRRGWRPNASNAESTIANTITKIPELKLKRSRSTKQKIKKKNAKQRERYEQTKIQKILESFINS